MASKFREREANLNAFVKQTRKSIELLISKEKNRQLKNLFKKMLNELDNSKWRFLPGKQFLQAREKRVGNAIVFEATAGQTIKKFVGGRRVFAEMVFPEGVVFSQDNSIKESGALTIWHELAHLAAKDPSALRSFAKTHGLTQEQAHEFISDRIAMELALISQYL
jgi:hypothetical protein